MRSDAHLQQFLCVVSEWSSIGTSGVRVGNAFPIYSLTKQAVVASPVEEFPNPGAIFLVNRGERRVWEFVVINPRENELYRNSKLRDCFYIGLGIPDPFDPLGDDIRVASVLDVPHFNIQSSDNVVRRPAQGVTPLFFIRDDYQRIYGPLKRTQVLFDAMERLDAIHWTGWGGECGVYEFTLERLQQAGCKLVTYQHPEAPNEVVQRPFSLLTGPVSRVTSIRVHDRMSDAQLAEWYLRLQGIPDIPEHILKALRAAPERMQSESSEQIRRRFTRLGQIYGTLDLIQTERQALAKRFLDSEEGQRLLENRLSREVDERSAKLDEEVRLQHGDLVAEQGRLAEQLDQAKVHQNKEKRRLDEELANLEKKHASRVLAIQQLEEKIRQGIDQIGGRLRDEFPVLAAVAGRAGQTVVVDSSNGVGGNAASGSTHCNWCDVSIPDPTKDLAVNIDEPTLVDRLVEDLRHEGLYFTRDFIANLYAVLKSSALNLVIGPPGYGKSSVVAAMARALGHGDAFLEIAVRRSWSDDRHLLGFYDAFHGRFDPGPSGLAPRLLQAQRDWEGDRRGIYMVLLDEFNLSAPEYYFSQLLQVVTRSPDQQRVVRLYDAAALPTFAADTVDQISVHPNVSFWGTINYDETTERLSPRLLDRTGMIFLSPRDVLPGERLRNGMLAPPAPGVRAREVCGDWVRTADQCPLEAWEKIEPLLELLGKQDEQWGPRIELSPRVLSAIRRYLANASSVLSAERAADFSFQQRVLPVLRGRGPQFAARISALEKMLANLGLERSARHVQEAAAIAAGQFGDVDFLAY